ncbi:MAG: cell division ATPase MinD [Candidatus Aenigmarchaeota archaeon]|nr:cell division ATPase MinD [Candidatus Aenigmarchaeota archaeon]
MARIISVFSGKGGVGKTTVTVNLGAALARMKKNVTLIDCNLTASHLGLHLGMYNPRSTLNHVLREEHSMEEALHEHFTGMKIVPASLALKDLHGTDLTKLRHAISTITHKNDVIMLDSAPGIGREAMASISASNEVLYVTTPHVPAIMDIIRCHEVASELGVEPLGIILNMINKDKHEMTKDEVEHLTGLPVIASISYDKNIRKSLAMKMPLVSYNPGTDTSKAFIKLASELMGEEIIKESGLFSILKRMRFW